MLFFIELLDHCDGHLSRVSVKTSVKFFFFSTILISLQSLNDPSDNCVSLESWTVSVKLDTNTMGIEMIFNSSFNMCK